MLHIPLWCYFSIVIKTLVLYGHERYTRIRISFSAAIIYEFSKIYLDPLALDHLCLDLQSCTWPCEATQL